jgi:ceramide glucosyltransferase
VHSTTLEIALLTPVLGGSLLSCLCLLAAHRTLRRRPAVDRSFRPPVTVLKPIYGLDKDLEANLRSLCKQDYPDFQVVTAVQRSDDPALAILRRLAVEYPDHITLVVEQCEPIVNGKVQNLVNALAAARNDVLIISDSDVRVRPDYLSAIVSPLRDPDVAYVCTLYRAVAADRWYEKLELLSINADFVPGLLFSYWSKVAPFCLGASVAFRRRDLDAVGGMADLSDYLVEDYELGRRLVGLGKRMVFVPYVVEILVGFPDAERWWQHQVYWDQNTKAANPIGFALTILTRAVPFALLYAVIRHFDSMGLAALAGALAVRLGTSAAFARFYLEDREGLRALWILPLRDLLALASWCIALTKRSFVWRGHRFGLTPEGRIVPRERTG